MEIRPHPPPGAWGTHAEPAYDVDRMNPVPALATAQPVAQAGIFLSRRKALLLAGAVVILLGVCFAAGLVVGLSLGP